MGHQILIFESQIQDSEQIDVALTAFGYEVVGRATNGSAALQLARETGADLAVLNMDLGMHQEAFELARDLRDLRIPVVFISPDSSFATMRRAAASGCFGYLLKPFRPGEFDAAIRIALHQHSTLLRAFARHLWLTSVFDSLSDGVIATSEDGSVRFLNPAAQVLTGWMAIDAIGKPIEAVYPLFGLDEVNKPAESQVRKALANCSSAGKGRFLLNTRYGVSIPVEESASPIAEGDTIVGAVTIFNNISARIAAENALEMEIDQLKMDVADSQSNLTRTNVEMQSLTERLLNVQGEERRRIAGELHDNLSQRVALMNQHVDRMASALEAQAGGKQPNVDLLRTMLSEFSKEIRDVAHRLHPSVVEDLGLLAALNALVMEYRELGVDVCISRKRVPDEIPLPIGAALFRIAQEALHNTLRHARGAPARISLTSERGQIHLRIEDAGPGFSVAEAKRSSGMGLLSMQERAKKVRGDFVLKTSPGDGTIISVTVPIDVIRGPQGIVLAKDK